MTELCAIEADYVNWRPVNGRKVLQLVFEVPLENTHDVLTRLGTPTPGESKWCAIALLNTKLGRDHREPSPGSQPNGEREVSGSASTSLQAEGGSPKKSWGQYKPSQQAYLLCRDPDFWRYIGKKDEASAAEWLCSQLRIESRSELDGDAHLEARWDEIVALYNLHRERHK